MVKRKLSEAVARAKPQIATERLCMRGDLVHEHERLQADLVAAKVGQEPGMRASDLERELAQRIVDLEAEMADEEVEFVFQAIGKVAWSDLLGKHGPTKEQKELRLDHNPETFSVAAITASLIEPDAQPADVGALAEVLSIGQWTKLWTACLKANVGDNTPGESSAASAILRASRPSSDTAAPAASPAASS